jgi:hypothetical protein
MAKSNNNSFDPKPILLIGGAVIGYLYVLKPLLETLGLKKTKAEKLQEQVEAENANNVNQWLQQTASGQQPTKSAGEWAIIADQIHQDLKFSALDDNKDDATYQVARVKNDADFSLLFKAFGKRQEYFFGIPTGGLQDLQQFIKGNLDSDKIAQINGNYSRKGIKYRF